jgi:hypothetical protein
MNAASEWGALHQRLREFVGCPFLSRLSIAEKAHMATDARLLK